MPESGQRSGGRDDAAASKVLVERFFFPAAAGYGAIAVPLSVHSMYGGAWAAPGLSSPLGHAHELLFGYALAVVAGFLINRMPSRHLALLAMLWLGARISWLAAPGSILSFVTNAGFGLAVAAIAAPRFMKGAKKWRNRLTGPIVISICLAAIIFQAAGLPAPGWIQYLALQESVLLFALLMVFFGGRLIAPAAAGAIQAAGGLLEARVQPRVEGALLVLLILATVLAIVPQARPASGVLLMVAGLLTMVRLLRWRLWQCRARIDLLCLGIGYAWLAVGLTMIGADWSLDMAAGQKVATHAITVGALGTLTTTIMSRVRLLHARRYPGVAWPFPALTVLIFLAALFRLVGDGNPGAMTLAAVFWSLALLVLFGVLLYFSPLLKRSPGQSAQPG